MEALLCKNNPILAIEYTLKALNQGIISKDQNLIGRGKSWASWLSLIIREENPDGISAYDLSYRLTELCQDLKSDVTRSKVEYLAGEVILCYDKIIKDMVAGDDGLILPSRMRGKTNPNLPLRYVSLN